MTSTSILSGTSAGSLPLTWKGRIAGCGSALPARVVTNADLERTLDTSDDWIFERTGIRQRHLGSTTAELAVAAGRAALRDADCDPAAVGMLILATTTPERTSPATASRVHRGLGLGGGAFDLNAGCTGFVYGLAAGYSFLQTGVDRVLVIGADTLSGITDWSDRTIAVLVGDGAGAVLLERSDRPDRSAQLLAWDAGCDGSAERHLYCDIGGTLHMDGSEIFRRAVRAVVQSASSVMRRAGVGADDIALMVPHQANKRIVDAACTRLGISESRTVSIIEQTGNTSAASVPLALASAADAGRISQGDLVLITGFGAGMTWASAVIAW